MSASVIDRACAVERAGMEGAERVCAALGLKSPRHQSEANATTPEISLVTTAS
jgi:hypothetical protein